MSNRRLRSIYGPSLSIHELRRLALGESIVHWCDSVEPELRTEWNAIQQQAARVMGELRADVDRLVLMPADSESERNARDIALENAQARLERQTAILERQTKIYQSLSAGGAASIWAAAQKGTARKAQENETGPESEPISRFVPKRLRQAESLQAMDAELIPETNGES